MPLDDSISKHNAYSRQLRICSAKITKDILIRVFIFNQRFQRFRHEMWFAIMLLECSNTMDLSWIEIVIDGGFKYNDEYS